MREKGGRIAIFGIAPSAMASLRNVVISGEAIWLFIRKMYATEIQFVQITARKRRIAD